MGMLRQPGCQERFGRVALAGVALTEAGEQERQTGVLTLAQARIALRKEDGRGTGRLKVMADDRLPGQVEDEDQAAWLGAYPHPLARIPGRNAVANTSEGEERVVIGLPEERARAQKRRSGQRQQRRTFLLKADDGRHSGRLVEARLPFPREAGQLALQMVEVAPWASGEKAGPQGAEGVFDPSAALRAGSCPRSEDERE
jgi:hypothetical protein